MMVVLLLLVLLGCLSPLLTAARLFQMKEWRMDRLREHLRAEGWFIQLFGIARPIVVILLLLGAVGALYPAKLAERSGVALLASLSIIQILLRRQPYPVWTPKAITLTATALLLDVLLFFGTVGALGLLGAILTTALPLLIVLQPLVLLFAQLLWHPVDRLLKARVMRRAQLLRAEHPEITAIGITGSVGKTTTKELLAHLLAPRGAVATPEYVNSEMGVAAWLVRILRMQDKGQRTMDKELRTTVPSPPSLVLVIEMGAYRKGEIRRLCSIVQPSIGILTAVGSAHRGLFGSEEAIQNAKAELLASLPETGHAFLNTDSDPVRTIMDRARCTVTTVGTQHDATVRADDLKDTDRGLSFRIGNERFRVPLRGTHNITNVLLAIAVARHLGMTDDEIRARLETFHSLDHTFAVREEHGVTLLDDTHNSSPESFRAGLLWARDQMQRPRALLSSGLLELGGSEDRELEMLGALAQHSIERAIFSRQRGRSAFAEGFGGDVELLSRATPPVPPGALLLCLGRLPLSAIQQLLPAVPPPERTVSP